MSIAVMFSLVRYFFFKKEILLINIVLSLIAMIDITLSAGWQDAGNAYGLFAISGSALQLYGINLSLFVRVLVAAMITVIFTVALGQYSSVLLMASFIVARFAESMSNVKTIMLMMGITHVIWLYYGFTLDAYIVMATQAVQIVIILILMSGRINHADANRRISQFFINKFNIKLSSC